MRASLWRARRATGGMCTSTEKQKGPRKGVASRARGCLAGVEEATGCQWAGSRAGCMARMAECEGMW